MKERLFLELSEEVKACNICKDILFTPFCSKSNCLIHDENFYEEPYVNRWNLIQNSLDAEIMVIGQDYGCSDEKNFVTDKVLKDIFDDVFQIDIKKRNPGLFFTNVANCYRKYKSTGEINNGCLYLCANKFLSRLIDIISPKVIVTLGKETFNALACCDKAKLICNNPTEEIEENTFKNIIKYKYSLKFENGREISVFPVYHPGANGRMNRTYNEQLDDWNKIKNFINSEE